jgi:dihydrodipicolinate synthase/N-acetylneuraminate lyase
MLSSTGSWVSTMKAAMNIMTPIDVGPPRPPLTPLSDEKTEELKKDLTSLQLH